ncbi:MAG: RNA polymerase sigma factor [Candidatus Limnocylindrales bacterium]
MMSFAAIADRPAQGQEAQAAETTVDAGDPLAERLATDLDGNFEALVVARQDLLYGIALRSTGDRGAAEELAQDAFVRAYRALAAYPPERIRTLHTRPWLARIVVNLCRNRARTRRARPAETQLDALLGAPAPSEGPEGALLRREAEHAWATRLAALPLHYRLAVELRHVHGLSYAELAETLDRPVNTVKVHVHRGLALLRTAYEQESRS